MANNTQTYTTRIFLNAEEAKKQLDELQQKVVRLRKEKEDAATKGDWPTFNRLKKELDKANNDILYHGDVPPDTRPTALYKRNGCGA